MLIISSVFDVLALSEVVTGRKGKKRGEETRRGRKEQKRRGKPKPESRREVRLKTVTPE